MTLDKIISEKGFQTTESAKYYSLIYDLYLLIDVMLTDEISTYVEKKIENILDRLYKSFMTEIKSQPIENFIK